MGFVSTYAYTLVHFFYIQVWTQVLQALCDAYMELHQNPHEPLYVQADGNPSISAAVAQIFPDARRLHCYYHVKSNIRKNKHRVKGTTAELRASNYSVSLFQGSSKNSL